MNLTSELTAALENRSLKTGERAELCCRLAKELEKAGEYEAACEALSEFWPERYMPPKIEGLDEATKADVLLRVGALAGWLGSVDQVIGSQETAKNLITRSIEIFDRLDDAERVAEARSDLALCYWREGSFDEARDVLVDVLSHLKNADNDLKAIVMIRAGIVEITARRSTEALRRFYEAATFVEQSQDHALKGTFHNHFAVLFRRLGTRQNRDGYLDRALIEYAAASFHFEQAGHIRYCAFVENNLGFLFLTIGKFAEAHSHINRARQKFLSLGDRRSVAQVDDTLARTMIAEGRFREAERVARSSVKTLENGGEQALLAEALTTHGIALAHLGRSPQSRFALGRAVEIAETAGDLEGAGRARLSIIEELGEQTAPREMASIFKAAADLLQASQDPSAGKRLISCAGKVIDAFDTQADAPRGVEDSGQEGWEDFSLKKELRAYERNLISRALKESKGAVTHAAKLLGFKHHQSLISLINTRHKDLLKTRSAVRRRRSHILSSSKKTGKPARRTYAKGSIVILHAEDNERVANLLGELFAAEEWQVELCRDGASALEKLASGERYHVLLFDNDLPGLSGLELVLRARSMPHRRRTRIIMLSGEDCETEAWRAGVDAFLRKPGDIDQVLSAIARLLDIELKDKFQTYASKHEA